MSSGLSPRPALLAFVVLAACTPWLVSGESTLLTGVVHGTDSASVEIEVYEHCSRRLVFLRRCPGKLLAQAKIAKPGRFVVEVERSSRELWVVAFRGAAPREVVCSAQTIASDNLKAPLELTLAEGPCPLSRPLPPTGVSSAAPSSSRGVNPSLGGYGAGFPRRR